MRELNLGHPPTAALLADVQGAILKPHGRTFTRLCFLEFTDPALARAWLVATAARITTVERLGEQALDAKSAAPALASSEKLAVSLHLTFSGLRFVRGDWIVRVSTAFKEGQIERLGGVVGGRAKHILGDDPSDWLAQPEKDYTRPIHALLSIAFEATEQPAAEALAATATPARGVRVVVEELGGRLHTAAGDDVEHFGFRENLSWLRFVPASKPGGELTPLRHVLCRAAPRPDGTERFGSFLVFRKLEQDVPAFLRAADVLADRFFSSPDAAGREQACAWIMGRFRDGTPRISSRLPAGQPVNNFDYAADSGDTAGNLCPFHAHIRKMNPRGDHSQPPSTRPADLLPVRRSVPYGDRAFTGDPAKRILAIDTVPAAPVGLLFMSYHRRVEDFEEIVANWANVGNFPHGTVASTDALIGQPTREPRDPRHLIRAPRGSGAGNLMVERYVIPRGGTYLFTPPLSFFSELAAGRLSL